MKNKREKQGKSISNMAKRKYQKNTREAYHPSMEEEGAEGGSTV